jgi:Tfp pilus assembly protein PilF
MQGFVLIAPGPVSHDRIIRMRILACLLTAVILPGCGGAPATPRVSEELHTRSRQKTSDLPSFADSPDATSLSLDSSSFSSTDPLPSAVGTVSRPVPSSAGPADVLASGGFSSPAAGLLQVAGAEVRRLESIPTFSSFATDEPLGDDEWLNQGITLFKQQKFDEAIKKLYEAIRRNPQSAKAHETLGVVYSSRNELSKAIANYDSALRLDPKLTNSYIYRGCANVRLQWNTRAIPDFDRAIELEPNNITALIWRACALMNERQFDKSIADSTRVMELAPTIGDAPFVRCLAYLQSGRFKEGRADFALAVRLGLPEESKKMVQTFLDNLPNP